METEHSICFANLNRVEKALESCQRSYESQQKFYDNYINIIVQKSKEQVLALKKTYKDNIEELINSFELAFPSGQEESEPQNIFLTLLKKKLNHPILTEHYEIVTMPNSLSKFISKEKYAELIKVKNKNIGIQPSISTENSREVKFVLDVKKNDYFFESNCYSQLKSKISSLEKQLALKSNLNQESITSSDLGQNVSALKLTLQQQHEECKICLEWKQNYNLLTENHKSLQVQYNELVEKNEKNEDSISKFNESEKKKTDMMMANLKKIDELKKELKSMKKELADSEEQRENLKQSSENTIQDLNSQIEELKNRLKENESESLNFKKTINMLEAEKNDFVTTIETLKQDISQLKSESENYKREIQAFKENANRSNELENEKLKKKKSKKADLKLQINNFSAELDQLRKHKCDHNKCNAAIDKLEKENKILQNNVIEITEQKNKISIELNVHKEQKDGHDHTNCESKLKLQMESYNVLKQEFDKLKIVNENLKNGNEASVKGFQEDQFSHNECNKKLDDLISKNKVLEDSLSSVTKEKNEVSLSMKNIESSHAALNLEYQALIKKNSETNNNNLEKIIEDLKVERDKLASKLNDIESGKVKHGSNNQLSSNSDTVSKCDHSRYEATIEELKTERDKLMLAVNKADSLIKDLRVSSANTPGTTIPSKEEKVTEADTKNSSNINENHKKLQIQIEDLNDQNSKLLEEIKFYKDKFSNTHEFKNFNVMLQFEKTRHMKEIENLKKQINLLLSEKDKLTKENEYLKGVASHDKRIENAQQSKLEKKKEEEEHQKAISLSVNQNEGSKSDSKDKISNSPEHKNCIFLLNAEKAAHSKSIENLKNEIKIIVAERDRLLNHSQNSKSDKSLPGLPQPKVNIMMQKADQNSNCDHREFEKIIEKLSIENEKIKKENQDMMERSAVSGNQKSFSFLLQVEKTKHAKEIEELKKEIMHLTNDKGVKDPAKGQENSGVISATQKVPSNVNVDHNECKKIIDKLKNEIENLSKDKNENQAAIPSSHKNCLFLLNSEKEAHSRSVENLKKEVANLISERNQLLKRIPSSTGNLSESDKIKLNKSDSSYLSQNDQILLRKNNLPPGSSNNPSVTISYKGHPDHIECQKSIDILTTENNKLINELRKSREKKTPETVINHKNCNALLLAEQNAHAKSVANLKKEIFVITNEKEKLIRDLQDIQDEGKISNEKKPNLREKTAARKPEPQRGPDHADCVKMIEILTAERDKLLNDLKILHENYILLNNKILQYHQIQMSKINEEQESHKNCNYMLQKEKEAHENSVQNLKKQIQEITVEREVVIKELQNEIEKLHDSTNKLLQDEKASHSKAIEDLHAQMEPIIEEKDKKIIQLQEELNELQENRNFQLQAEKTCHSKLIDECKNELILLINDKEKKIEDLQNNYKISIDKLTHHHEAEKLAYNKLIEENGKNMSKVTSEYLEMKHNYDSIIHERDAQKKLAADLANQIKNITMEREKNVQELNAKLNEYIKNLNILLQEKEMFTRTLESLKAQIGSLTTERDKIRIELGDLRKNCTAITQDRDSNHKIIENLKNQITLNNIEKEKMVVEINETRKNYYILIQEKEANLKSIENFKSQISTNSIEKDKTIQQLQGELRELKININILIQEKDTHTKGNENLKSQINNVTNEKNEIVKKLQGEINDLKKNLNNLNQDKLSQAKQIDSQKNQIILITNERDKIIRQLQDELNETRKINNGNLQEKNSLARTVENQKNQFNMVIVEKETNLKRLQDELDELRKNYTAVLQEKAAHLRTIDSYKNQITIITIEKEKAIREIQGEIGEMRKLHNSTLKEKTGHEKNIDNLKSQLNLSATEKEKLNNLFQNEIQDLKKINVALTFEKNAHSKTIEGLKHQLQTLASNFDHLQKEANNHLKHIESFHQEKETNLKMIENLRNLNNSINSEKEKIIKQNQKDYNDLEKVVLGLTQERDNLLKNVEYLKEQLSSVSTKSDSTIQQCKNELNEFKKNYNIILQERDAAIINIENMKEQINIINQQKDKLIQQLQAELANLGKAYNVLRQDKEDLAKSVSEREHYLQKIEDELSDLRKGYRNLLQEKEDLIKLMGEKENIIHQLKNEFAIIRNELTNKINQEKTANSKILFDKNARIHALEAELDHLNNVHRILNEEKLVLEKSVDNYKSQSGILVIEKERIIKQLQDEVNDLKERVKFLSSSSSQHHITQITHIIDENSTTHKDCNMLLEIEKMAHAKSVNNCKNELAALEMQNKKLIHELEALKEESKIGEQHKSILLGKASTINSQLQKLDHTQCNKTIDALVGEKESLLKQIKELQSGRMPSGNQSAILQSSNATDDKSGNHKNCLFMLNMEKTAHNKSKESAKIQIDTLTREKQSLLKELEVLKSTSQNIGGSIKKIENPSTNNQGNIIPHLQETQNQKNEKEYKISVQANKKKNRVFDLESSKLIQIEKELENHLVKYYFNEKEKEYKININASSKDKCFISNSEINGLKNKDGLLTVKEFCTNMKTISNKILANGRLIDQYLLKLREEVAKVVEEYEQKIEEIYLSDLQPLKFMFKFSQNMYNDDKRMFKSLEKVIRKWRLYESFDQSEFNQKNLEEVEKKSSFAIVKLKKNLYKSIPRNDLSKLEEKKQEHLKYLNNYIIVQPGYDHKKGGHEANEHTIIVYKAGKF